MKRTRYFFMLALVFRLGANPATAQNLVWEPTNGPCGGTVHALAIDKMNEYIFAAVPNLNSWHKLFEGDIYALAFNDSDHIFMGTADGLFRAQLTTNVKESVSEMPRAFALTQNHPNPFNSSTTIKYELPQAVEVQLAIWDLTGRRVRTLVQQQQPAGQYEVIWDGRNEQGEAIASGLYNYQLRAGTFTQARRMALVR